MGKGQDIVEEILANRIAYGCPACGREWTKKDLEKNFPSYGVACTLCQVETKKA